MKAQWVCRVCGYNMIGKRPDVCPFCGEPHSVFLTWQETEAAYRVTSTRVNDYVTRLMSVPRLGLEHAAYRVETGSGPIWIDSPSAFNRNLPAVQHIFFTHPDFMGACNQYREHWAAEVHLHRLDAANPLVRDFPVDDPFDGDFVHREIEAFHIGGHTPGFTVYLFKRVLFVCDYAYPPDETMHFNPHSPSMEGMRERGARIRSVTEGRGIETVCGYNFVVPFDEWMPRFEALLAA